jgi:thioredoxin reductase (NADPH)
VTNPILETRRAQMFPKLTAAQIARLEGLGRRMQTQAGDVLVSVGERPREFFVVVSGSLEIESPSSAEFEFVTRLTPGDFTGELSTLRGSAGLARVRARESGSVIAIEVERLRAIVQTDAELSELFMRAFILRRMGLLATGHGDIMLVGSSYSPDTLRLREFLGRNGYPFLNVDIESDPDVHGILEHFAIQPEDTPVVVWRGKRICRNPGNRQLADYLALNPQVEAEEVHDLLIVGAGPAGLAAAVYAASEGLDVRIVETIAPGGQAGTSSRIENYLGFPTGISGQALAGRALAQAQKFGARLSVAWPASRLHCDEWPYCVEFEDGSAVRTRTILIASGAQYRPLDIPDLGRFIGSGVHYAATHIEAKLCEQQEIVIVGGGNSAGQAAAFLSGSSRHVHLLVRSDGLAQSMSRYLIRRIDENPQITLHPLTELTALQGAGHLERVTWRRRGGSTETHAIKHVFMMTGAVPQTRWLAGCVVLDDRGFVKTGSSLSPTEIANAGWPLSRTPDLLETSVPGVFAAGDVRAGSVKRVASAVGEGSICVSFVHRALAERAALEEAAREHAALAPQGVGLSLGSRGDLTASGSGSIETSDATPASPPA